MVVAVIVFICKLNEVEVILKDLASQLNVAGGTCKLRYKEILKRLVDVARVHMPWGNDVSVKNIMKNAPIVIQYMEMKSMCNPAKQIKTLEEVRRKEKIEAAKKRIEKIRRPSMAANESGDLCVRLPVCSSKRKRRDTDWEDFVIETLLLHHVKEEEIEKGCYNTLLDLHVFNSRT
ncbi:hypothetical protein L6452_08046 [Arctium lappa]|uniref:Uncharacterized protein n=1 Tax=Arctium lappa TaxID=4217 RepID=A0ACB9DG74_ARCLA|nr:hypothetical protein L6452_08046 [Arctium lappa]